MNILPQNLQIRHKLGPQQTITLLEFQLELLVQDQIRMIHNHIEITLHDATLPSTFPLIQMMRYKRKLKIQPHSVILLLMSRHLQELSSIIHKIKILHKL